MLGILADVILLVTGLGGLWLGTEVTLRGAVSISTRLGMSEFVVGVVILSVGSDLPELAVAIGGALANLRGGDTSDLIVGSAIGSLVGQIGFVLGVTGLLALLSLPRKVVRANGPVLLGSLLLLGLFGLDGGISRVEGVLLVFAYALYVIYLLTDEGLSEPESDEHDGLTPLMAFGYTLFGLGIVALAAEFTVRGAGNVATALDIGESVVAIVVIGLGTSLPELSISVGAVMRGRTRMSVGNLIGSNIFDTLVPIGVAAAIANLKFDFGLLSQDLPYLFLLSSLVLFFFWCKRGIQRPEAAIILLAYLAYIGVTINGG